MSSYAVYMVLTERPTMNPAALTHIAAGKASYFFLLASCICYHSSLNEEEYLIFPLTSGSTSRADGVVIMFFPDSRSQREDACSVLRVISR